MLVLLVRALHLGNFVDEEYIGWTLESMADCFTQLCGCRLEEELCWCLFAVDRTRINEQRAHGHLIGAQGRIELAEGPRGDMWAWWTLQRVGERSPAGYAAGVDGLVSSSQFWDFSDFDSSKFNIFISMALSLLVSLVSQTVKNLLSVQETQLQFLGQEDLLEKRMAIPSSILAWKNPMDRGAWWNTVCEITESQIRLSD